MKKLLLHIGTGKTGSSTLQKTLKRQQQEDALNGIAYPKIGSLSNHNELCTLVMPHDRVRRDIRSKYPSANSDYECFRSSIRQALDYALSQDNKNLILSGEYFCGFSDDEVVLFKELLEQYNFSEIKVVVYFRPPVELYLSQIQQRIKASSKFANPNNYKFYYKDIYTRWKFSFKNIEVREFKKERLVEGDVVSDFYSLINSFFGVNLTVPKKIGKSNESLSTAGMLIQHEYRRFIYPSDNNVFKKDSTHLLKLINDAERMSGLTDKPRLQQWVKESIIDNNKEELNWLERELGIDFSYDIESHKSDSEKNCFGGALTDVLEVDEHVLVQKQQLVSMVLKALLEA